VSLSAAQTISLNGSSMVETLKQGGKCSFDAPEDLPLKLADLHAIHIRRMDSAESLKGMLGICVSHA